MKKLDPTKAVVLYARLTRQPRDQLAEIDLRKLAEAELVLRDMDGLELVRIVRANTLLL